MYETLGRDCLTLGGYKNNIIHVKPLFTALLLLALQAPTPGRLPLQGRVVKSGTNDPIARASIVVAKVEGRLEDYRTILTDGSGRFAFTDLTPGT
jgi:hypothetical protein